MYLIVLKPGKIVLITEFLGFNLLDYKWKYSWLINSLLVEINWNML